jgi:hypothetical protein
MTPITGESFKDAILVIAGNIFIVIFIFRTVGAYAKKEWGELITNLLAAILIVGFVYFTDSSINVLKWFWGLITG